MGQGHPLRMTNAESLASVVTALGGTPSGTSNKELLSEIVTALGGTPSLSDTNDELIAKIADNASGGGGEWRLWSGDPEAEPLADATTHEWLVDCEIYAAVTGVFDEVPSLPFEGMLFARKGDAAAGPVGMGATAWVEGEGSRTPVAMALLYFLSLTPEDGAVTAGGVAVPTDAPDSALWEDISFAIDASLAFNDETQPDRVMVWIR